MLNMVEVNGSRAYVDVTYGLVNKELPITRYDFFLVTDRIINKEFITPDISNECNDEKVNYFVKNDLRFSSAEDMRRYLCAFAVTSNNSTFRVHYDGKQMDDTQLKDYCLEIINNHCQEGKFAKMLCKNGFCSGKISDVED